MGMIQGFLMSPWRTVFQNHDFLMLYLEDQKQKLTAKEDDPGLALLGLGFSLVLYSWQLPTGDVFQASSSWGTSLCWEMAWSRCQRHRQSRPASG